MAPLIPPLALRFSVQKAGFIVGLVIIVALAYYPGEPFDYAYMDGGKTARAEQDENVAGPIPEKAVKPDKEDTGQSASHSESRAPEPENRL